MSFTQRNFTFTHNGVPVEVVVWNENKANPTIPTVLYDCHNVSDTFPIAYLQEVAGTQNEPYAIISLIKSKGKIYNGMKKQAKKNPNEMIVIVLCEERTKVIGDGKVYVETGVKKAVMEQMGWKSVHTALDDKSHLWEPYQSQIQLNVNAALAVAPYTRPIFKMTFQ